MVQEENYIEEIKEDKIFNDNFSNSDSKEHYERVIYDEGTTIKEEDISKISSIDEIKQLEKKLRDLKAKEREDKRLDLVKTDKEGLKQGIRKDGKVYSVRDNRERFFYPGEWIKFYEKLKPSQQFTFKFLVNTGCRINEARHIRVGDIDLESKRILVRITKVKAKKGEKNPKPRTIPISSEFAKYLKGIFRKYNLSNDSYLASSNNPKEDEMGENSKLFVKFGIKSMPAGNIAIKKVCEKAGIKDYWNFSDHNIRKTLENWLLGLGVNEVKLSKHMGHDISTMIQHYISPDVLTFDEKRLIREIIGDLYRERF